jgi:hypothetical protein
MDKHQLLKVDGMIVQFWQYIYAQSFAIQVFPTYHLIIDLEPGAWYQHCQQACILPPHESLWILMTWASRILSLARSQSPPPFARVAVCDMIFQISPADALLSALVYQLCVLPACLPA